MNRYILRKRLPTLKLQLWKCTFWEAQLGSHFGKQHIIFKRLALIFLVESLLPWQFSSGMDVHNFPHSPSAVCLPATMSFFSYIPLVSPSPQGSQKAPPVPLRKSLTNRLEDIRAGWNFLELHTRTIPLLAFPTPASLLWTPHFFPLGLPHSCSPWSRSLLHSAQVWVLL